MVVVVVSCGVVAQNLENLEFLVFGKPSLYPTVRGPDTLEASQKCHRER
jgi:hypothetical protein